MRQAAGMTLQDVATKVGTTAVTVSRWERESHRVTLPVLKNLAHAIGCSEAELVGGDIPSPLAAAITHVADYFGVPQEHFAIIVVPTDMMEPTIKKGDVVYIDRRLNSVADAGIFAFILNGQARLLRAHRNLENGIRFTGDNDLYKVDFTWPVGKLELIGKVIGVTSKV
jgi:transcriptional regulator with XRE-family HTH domain